MKKYLKILSAVVFGAVLAGIVHAEDKGAHI